MFSLLSPLYLKLIPHIAFPCITLIKLLAVPSCTAYDSTIIRPTMSQYPNLLSPIRMGKLELPNRVVMAPMTRGRAGPTYTANKLMAEYYAQRASTGLIITEGTHISLQARGWFQAPEIYTKEHAEAWKVVTDAVHKKGGRIFCQLWHSGRCSHSNFREGMEGVEDPLSVAPSAIKRDSHSGKQGYTNAPGMVDIEKPRELSTEEVEELPNEYRNAAAMAKEAGFDGVEVHGANGYLIDEFLQTVSNKRTDKYGGSLENRFRIVDEVLKAIFEVYESDCVGLRISPNGAFNGMGSDDYRESFLYYAERLLTYDLAYLHVMIGLGFGFHGKGEPMTMADFKKVYPRLLVANVGYTPEMAEKEIAEGDTDLVSFGRPLLSNPDFVERLAKNAGMNPPADRETYYASVEHPFTSEGYTDYPTLSES